MKENIKKMIVGSFIFYCTTIVILMLFNYNNAVVEILVSDTELNMQTLNNYKKQVQLLEKNECTEVISALIDYYEKFSYDTSVNLKEIYDYDMENGGLRFFSEAREKCNLSDDDIVEYDLIQKFMSYVISGEHFYQKYMFQYEISLKDIGTRRIGESALDNIDYSINQKTKLEIIDNLLEIYNERMVEHE